MITPSCYDTTVFEGFPHDRVQKSLLAALAAGSLAKQQITQASQSFHFELMDMHDVYYLVDPKAHHLESVPLLKHPFVVTDPKTHVSSIFIDLRTMLSFDRINERYGIKGGMYVDFTMMIMRAQVQRIWLDGHQIEMRSCSSLPGVIFARWISSTLAQKYMLDPREQETIEVLTGYYYYCMFSAPDGNHDGDADRVVSYMSRAMGMQSTRCYEVIDQLKGRIDSIDELCVSYEKITGSVRLKDFNPGHLFTAIGMGYFGMQGRELTALACEHPPTWLVMLSYAVDDSMYRKSNIGTMMDKGAMKQRAEDFVQALHQLISTYATV